MPGRGSALRERLSLAVLTPAAVVLAACGGTGGGGGENGQNGNDQAPPTPGGQTTPAPGGPNETAAGANAGDEEGRTYERTWRVGDGGEVEIRYQDGALDLIDARPNEGWDVDVEEQDADEIEVDFDRGDETWGFDAEVDDGRLEVQTRQEIRSAEGGTYRLGDAGAVELRREGGSLTLVQTQTGGGWSEQVRQNGDEAEVRFERAGELWKLEAEVDDGRLEVDTVRRITEPVRE